MTITRAATRIDPATSRLNATSSSDVPQALLANLEYAGLSVPGRRVGSDYCAFLDLAPGHLAFVIGDVSANGIRGARLLANLRAILHSQLRSPTQDLRQVLQSAHRLFYENAASIHYATLFVGHYDDFHNTLSYVNCGHHPPLLLHEDADEDWLDATAPPLGLSARLDCSMADVRLAEGDVLVMYTDGVIETENSDGEEFGVERLAEVLRSDAGVPASLLVNRALSAVERFRAGEPSDDMSLIVAASRTAPRSRARVSRPARLCDSTARTHPLAGRP